jgi:putative membrane protein
MMNDGLRNGGWGGGHWIVALLMMVLFWGAIAVVVLAVVRSGTWSRRDHHPGPPPGPPPADPTGDAERILHERFARGEIDDAEYTRRLDLIKGRSPR